MQGVYAGDRDYGVVREHEREKERVREKEKTKQKQLNETTRFIFSAG